jgi:voltage-gated potassium channel Kch
MPPVHRIHYRFGPVLLLIVLAVAFTLAAPSGDGARFVAVVLQASVLVAALVASKAHPWLIRLSVAGALVGLVGAAAALFGSGRFGNASSDIVALLYLVLTPPAIGTGLRKQFREAGAVTLETMFGVLCLYLLIGLIFGVAYGVVDQLNNSDIFNVANAGRDDFLYFSYTTLTTTGYGDVVARTDLGRSMAITEALIGQLYLVTVVALIISNLRPRGAKAESSRAN